MKHIAPRIALLLLASVEASQAAERLGMKSEPQYHSRYPGDNK